MTETPPQSWLGPAVFVVTLIAILAFLWWFLLYRHGAPAGPIRRRLWRWLSAS